MTLSQWEQFTGRKAYSVKTTNGVFPVVPDTPGLRDLGHCILLKGLEDYQIIKFDNNLIWLKPLLEMEIG